MDPVIPPDKKQLPSDYESAALPMDLIYRVLEQGNIDILWIRQEIPA